MTWRRAAAERPIVEEEEEEGVDDEDEAEEDEGGAARERGGGGAQRVRCRRKVMAKVEIGVKGGFRQPPLTRWVRLDLLRVVVDDCRLGSGSECFGGRPRCGRSAEESISV